MQYVASRPEQRRVLGAVQLGNEPGHYLDNCHPHEVGDCVSPEEHGRDFLQPKELLVEVMDEEKPVLQGPDDAYYFTEMKCALFGLNVLLNPVSIFS